MKFVPVVSLSAALLTFGTSAFAASSLYLGETTARPGTTVVIPVRVALDRATGSSVQAFSFQFDIEPSSAVSKVQVRPAGVTSAVEPLFKMEVTGKKPGYIASLPQSIELLARQNSTEKRESSDPLIAEVVVTLSGDAVAGTRIQLNLESNTTSLNNQGGTATASVANGGLELRNASIRVADETEAPGRAVQQKQ